MNEKIAKDYIANISKATAYYTFRNGPIKELVNSKKISEDELKDIQKYLEGHMAYLYTVLLEENNLNKLDLVVRTMNNFYVNDKEEVLILDEGFDELYAQLFSKVGNISIQKK